jgi:endonuclease/exonuclease/phosphatase family metal-dependent hydrolase
VRVLTWNLFHGRSQPPAGRGLLAQFAQLLASWEWDVALLQEVPPWWPPALARAARAEQRTALTSRNSLLPVRRVLASRWPDLMKSNGGGANAILSRGPLADYLRVRLRAWPERRVAQVARVAGGPCVANYHGSTRVELAEQELARLWQLALACAREATLVLGGDLNLRDPAAAGGARHVARRDVDHVFVLGPAETVAARVLDRRATAPGGSRVELSDHPPLLVELR